jgi:hypothetical protein
VSPNPCASLSSFSDGEYAVTIEKDVLVLAEKSTKLPANLQGLVVQRYSTRNRSEFDTFRSEFIADVRLRLMHRSISGAGVHLSHRAHNETIVTRHKAWRPGVVHRTLP